MDRTFALKLQEPSATGKPWMILIHGLGLSHGSWVDPFGESLLGGAISFDYALTDLNDPPRRNRSSGANILSCSPPLRLSRTPPLSFWESLKGEGYGILTWSQAKPRGRIEHALGELQAALEAVPSVTLSRKR
jgi:pimeloyl-ACP methyl ester carboxylesterase